MSQHHVANDRVPVADIFADDKMIDDGRLQSIEDAEMDSAGCSTGSCFPSPFVETRLPR